jgi:hypothetical protein
MVEGANMKRAAIMLGKLGAILATIKLKTIMLHVGNHKAHCIGAIKMHPKGTVKRQNHAERISLGSAK